MSTHNTGPSGRESKSVSDPERSSAHVDDKPGSSQTQVTDLSCQSFDPDTGELLTSETEMTIRDELTLIDGGASAEAHPLFNLEPDEIVALNHLKRGAAHVGKSLAISLDLQQAVKGAKIFACADHLRPSPEGYRALTRCKSRVCPHCSHISSIKWVAKVRAGIKHMSGAEGYYLTDEPTGYAERFPNGAMIALKVTLNTGKACELSELSDRLWVLHKAFSNYVAKLKRGDDFIGAFRSTEIVETLPTSPGTASQAHPHLHGFILLRADVELPHLIHELLTFWPSTLKRIYNKHLNKSINTVASVRGDEIEPLTEQSIEHLTSWVKYITKGSYDLTSKSGKAQLKREAHLATSPEFWTEVEQVTKRAKMVEKFGLLRSSMRAAQKEYEATKKRCPRGVRESSKVRPDDLIYDHALKTYVRSEHILDRPNPHAYTESLSHLYLIPHFNALWRSERARYEEAAAARQRAQLWRVLALQSLDLPIIIREKQGLVLINSRDCQERSREPHEIDRSSPPQHGSPKSSTWLPYKDD